MVTIPAKSSIEGDCEFEKGKGFSNPIKNYNIDGGWNFTAVEVNIISVK
jgi:hypothetical protein